MASRIVERQDFTPSGFKWLGLSRIQWEGPDGKLRFWEAAQRTSRKGDVDGVAIIAKVRSQGQPLKVVLEAQFRPSQGNTVVELPAGLIDAGEDAATAAIRELKEETGYSGAVSSVSPVCYSDPGMTNANMQFVEVEVDADAPENASVDPELEEGEFIDVFLLPFDGLYAALMDLQKEKGWDVDARLLMYAAGLDLGKTLSPPAGGELLTDAALDPTAAVAPAVEIAVWDSPTQDRGDGRSGAASGLSLSASQPQMAACASRQSLMSAAGFDGGGGNGGGSVLSDNGAASVATTAATGAGGRPGPKPVVVTPEELRQHGIDRVRIVPQGSLKWRRLDKYTLTAAGLGLALGIGVSQVLAGLALAMGISYNPRVRFRW